MMELEWENRGEYHWLREVGKLLSESNHYDIHMSRGVFNVKAVGHSGKDFETGATVAGPFDTLQEAKDVAEMLHRMEAWK
jgi:hypothetical protein